MFRLALITPKKINFSYSAKVINLTSVWTLSIIHYNHQNYINLDSDDNSIYSSIYIQSGFHSEVEVINDFGHVPENKITHSYKLF
jgi:hypothetical protein